jgi:integrase
VRVFEREPGGQLWAAVRTADGQLVRVSLGHRDRERAEHYAIEQAAEIRKGTSALAAQRASLGIIIAAYLEEVLPTRRHDKQRLCDRRAAELWIRYLGYDMDPTTIRPADWQRFQRDRAAGVIDVCGRRIAQEDRQTVGPRTVAADLTWLRGALNWATGWVGSDNRPLLSHNPTNSDKKRAYKMPAEKNPQRPVATIEQYLAIREHAHLVTCGGNARRPTCLLELLDLAMETGRRITAIASLRYCDLTLTKTAGAPHGSIRWAAEFDKQGRETKGPISEAARAAIDRVLDDRPGLGTAWLFPHPADASVPVTGAMARKWLYRAADLAEIERPRHWGWHSFRRAWASARRHLPPADVAKAGGWKNTATLMELYQQADEPGVLAVILAPAYMSDGTTSNTGSKK